MVGLAADLHAAELPQAAILFNVAAAAVQAAQACDVTTDAGLKAAAKRYQVGSCDRHLTSYPPALTKLYASRHSSTVRGTPCAEGCAHTQ